MRYRFPILVVALALVTAGWWWPPRAAEDQAGTTGPIEAANSDLPEAAMTVSPRRRWQPPRVACKESEAI